MHVPAERALAFIGAMVDWEDVGECQARPKSSHMWTHLEAVLGLGKVPDIYAFRSVVYNDAAYRHEREKVLMLVEYLEGVIKTLRAMMEE